MINELAILPILYPGFFEMVYAPKWYYTLGVKQDAYSREICYCSKRLDRSNYFFSHVREVLDELSKKGILNDLDLISSLPSHNVGAYSPTLIPLAEKISDYLNVPDENIISRTKSTREGGQRLDTRYSRFLSVRDSMTVTRELNENKIMLLDDVKTTGVTILETKRILFKAGLKKTVTVCFGINSRIDRG